MDFGDLIAVVALAISLVTMVVLLRDRRRRVRAVVRMEPYKRGIPILAFVAVNDGHHTVFLQRYGFILPDGNKLGFYPPEGSLPAPQLPSDLLAGRRISAWEFPPIVANDLRRWGWGGTVRIGAFYEDETMRVFRSDPFVFDIDRWAATSGPSPDRPMFDKEVARLRAATDKHLPWMTPRRSWRAFWWQRSPRWGETP